MAALVPNGGRYPGAIWDPIKDRSTMSNQVNRLTIHTSWTNVSDLYGPKKGSGGTYSHFYNPTSETMRQGQEIHHRSYADLDANGRAVSVEHQDERRDMPLSASQIDGDARLFAYLVLNHNLPNRIATPTDTTGLAWHRLGCRGNFGTYNRYDMLTWSGAQTRERWTTVYGKTCPTNPRIRQIPSIWNLAQDYIAGKNPDSSPVSPVPLPKPAPTKTKLLVDGDFGSLTKAALQRALGVLADGWIGPVTVRALQSHLGGLRVDGDWGPWTTRRLQRYLGGLTPDGVFGPVTTRALQRRLNKGTF